MLLLKPLETHRRVSPRQRSERFEYEDGDCLYRDHHGDRVLADVEGAGEFKIVQAVETCLIIVDDILQQERAGTFRNSLLATCREDGRSIIDVRQGALGPVEGSPRRCDRFEGTGYILKARRIGDLDGEHRLINGFGYPVPVFREASGAEMHVVAVGLQAITVDAFDVSDPSALKEREWNVQNASKLSMLTSTFPDGRELSSELISHLNAASWRVPIPPNCLGLLIRRRYDAFHGRQRARVLVDSEPIGWWYAPEQDRIHRWRWSQFGIEPQNLSNRGEITLTIDPPAGSPLWSVSRIEVWALIGALPNDRSADQ